MSTKMPPLELFASRPFDVFWLKILQEHSGHSDFEKMCAAAVPKIQKEIERIGLSNFLKPYDFNQGLFVLHVVKHKIPLALLEPLWGGAHDDLAFEFLSVVRRCDTIDKLLVSPAAVKKMQEMPINWVIEQINKSYLSDEDGANVFAQLASHGLVTQHQAHCCALFAFEAVQPKLLQEIMRLPPPLQPIWSSFFIDVVFDGRTDKQFEAANQRWEMLKSVRELSPQESSGAFSYLSGKVLQRCLLEELKTCTVLPQLLNTAHNYPSLLHGFYSSDRAFSKQNQLFAQLFVDTVGPQKVQELMEYSYRIPCMTNVLQYSVVAQSLKIARAVENNGITPPRKKM